MNTIYKELRQFLGIPQTMMADHLGVTRSHLAMIESRRRSLSAGKFLSILDLFKIMEASGQQKMDDEKLQKARKSQNVKKQTLIEGNLFISRYKLKILQKNLAKLQTAQERSTKVINLVSSMKATASKENEALLSLIEHQSRGLQEKTSEDKQFSLQLQILSLEFVINYLEQELSNNKQE
jgi:transcriptional regulator with XRE-family HTH domain